MKNLIFIFTIFLTAVSSIFGQTDSYWTNHQGGAAVPIDGNGDSSSMLICSNAIFIPNGDLFVGNIGTGVVVEGNWKVEMRYGATTNSMILRYDGMAYAIDLFNIRGSMRSDNLHYGADFISDVVPVARLLIQ